MKILPRLFFVLPFCLGLVSLRAEGTAPADQRKSPLIGHWSTQFETPLQDIKLAGDAVSFTENFSSEGRETKITYTGTLAGDELRLTRSAGSLAVEEIVARRVTVPPRAAPKPNAGSTR